MVNHLNLGDSRHDTTTGVSWKSGVGSFLFYLPLFLSPCRRLSRFFLFNTTCIPFREDLRGWRLFFFPFFFWKGSRDFLAEFVGVFLRTQTSSSDGRFRSASTT
ncbi:hypothetical protein V8C37DRAFT_116800 [Trichoderma ceciliae]